MENLICFRIDSTLLVGEHARARKSHNPVNDAQTEQMSPFQQEDLLYFNNDTKKK